MISLLAAVLAVPLYAQDLDVEASTDDVSVLLSTQAPTIPITLDVFVKVAVDRNLSFLGAEAAAASARYSGKAADAAFDPVFNAAYSQSKQAQAVVTIPGKEGVQVLTKSQTIQGQITKATSIGSQFALTAQNVRTEQTVIAPIQPFYNTSVALSLTQPLLQGGGRSAAYAAARIAALGGEAALASAQRALETTIASVEAAYWTLRQSEQDLQAALKSLQIADETWRRNQQLNRLKLLSDHDMLTSEEQAETIRVTALAAARGRRDAADALVFLVYGEAIQAQLEAEKLTVSTSTGAPSLAVTVLPPAEAAKAALEERADVRAARKTFQQAEASLALASNGLYPILNANGQVAAGGTNLTGKPGAAEDSVKGALKNRDHQWSFGATFSMPIGNRPARDRYNAAAATREQARLNLIAAENQALTDVRAAVRAVETERVRYVVAKRAAAVSWRQFEGERARQKLGLVDSFRALQAENLALQSEQTLHGVQLALEAARINYRLAVGIIAQGYMQKLQDLK